MGLSGTTIGSLKGTIVGIHSPSPYLKPSENRYQSPAPSRLGGLKMGLGV